MHGMAPSNTGLIGRLALDAHKAPSWRRSPAVRCGQDVRLVIPLTATTAAQDRERTAHISADRPCELARASQCSQVLMPDLVAHHTLQC